MNQANEESKDRVSDPPSTSRELKLKYTSKDGTYFSQLYNKPLVTTLNSFSQVANLVRNPYELINNVDEFVKQHAANHSGKTAINSQKATPHCTNPCTTQPKSFIAGDVALAQDRELDEFTGGRFHPSASNQNDNIVDHPIPPPALPRIECTNKQRRLPPLTIKEYIESFQNNPEINDEKLITRIFRGSMDSNLLRSVLWPVIFNLVEHCDSIVEIDGAYQIVEDERNVERWSQLKNKFDIYHNQWRSILPEQESRFSTFRERKSLIERDVIRCDRLHPFYVTDPNHLDALTTMLMTYMMYDFDIGYVQGMSDLAAPILYVFNGNLTKAFWVFAGVMKLFRRNFELSQKTIHFQLASLFKLINLTDPCFAEYLTQHESSNCFFAFRCIVCQFKRELMKEDEDDYAKVLFLWDTVWCAQRIADIKKKREEKNSNSAEEALLGKILEGVGKSDSTVLDENCSKDGEKKEEIEGKKKKPIEKFSRQAFYASFDPNQADLPRFTLSETEKFVLSLCLSLIRRERDRIMASRLDSTEILQHFIDPKLSEEMDSFIEHATNIYSYLQNDLDIDKVMAEEEVNNTATGSADEGYDLLNDYLIIGAATGD